MLKKIIAIKNVGRFRSSAASGNPQLAKYTFVSAANGYGKTTLCAVLRSLQTGDSAHVLGRRTLGAADPPFVELMLDVGNARFDGVTWSTTMPDIAIFDGVFVAENVHSGDLVDLGHKRNLYRIIVGDAGVKLAEEEAELAGASRAKTSELGALSKSLQPFMPAGMTLDTFMALPQVADTPERIEAQRRTVDALRQADALRARASLLEFNIPTLPDGFDVILSRTIDDVAQDAEQRLAAHLTAHGIVGGGNWIASGLEHAVNTCPFCGQGIRELPLIAAFRAVFSDRYKALTGEITAAKAQLVRDLGDIALARIDTVAEQNNSAIEFWQNYCSIDYNAVQLPAEAVEAARSLATAALELLERKAAMPLERIAESESFIFARQAYDSSAAAILATNVAIQSANKAIAEKKTVASDGDLKSAEIELVRLKAIQIRHRDDVAELCNSHAKLLAKKVEIESRKETVRAQLEAHTKSVAKPYERRLNEYLTAFNAGFSITETKHAFLEV